MGHKFGDMAAVQPALLQCAEVRQILFKNDTILDNIQWKTNKLQIISLRSSNQTKMERKKTVQIYNQRLKKVLIEV